MKKAIILLFITLTAISNVCSQKNLQPGYIVLNNNDTLKGFINYREWDKTPAGILFAVTKQANLKRYDKNSVGYFEITSKAAYRRYKVKISLDTDLFTKMAEKDTSSKTDTIFLKILYRGKNVSLFSYDDEVKKRYYLLANDEPIPVELRNSIYLTDGKVFNEKEYQKQLLGLSQKIMPENAIITESIKNADYTSRRLLAVCYQLDGLSRDFKQIESHKAPFRFFAGSGMNRGSLKFFGDNKYTKAAAGPLYAPLIIAGVDMFINPDIGNFFVRNSIGFTRYKSDVSLVEKHYEATEYYHYNLIQNNLSFQSQLSYHLYNQPSFKWFLGAGAGCNFSAYSKNIQTLIRHGLSDTTVQSADNYIRALKKFWLNLSVVSGVTINNIEVAVCYSFKSNISNYLNHWISNSSLQLQVIYLFKRREK